MEALTDTPRPPHTFALPAATHSLTHQANTPTQTTKHTPKPHTDCHTHTPLTLTLSALSYQHQHQYQSRNEQECKQTAHYQPLKIGLLLHWTRESSTLTMYVHFNLSPQPPKARKRCLPPCTIACTSFALSSLFLIHVCFVLAVCCFVLYCTGCCQTWPLRHRSKQQ